MPAHRCASTRRVDADGGVQAVRPKMVLFKSFEEAAVAVDELLNTALQNAGSECEVSGGMSGAHALSQFPLQATGETIVGMKVVETTMTKMTKVPEKEVKE